ncbi:MAG: hypothetical protein IVW54_14140 [Candidatus Binataceae bacterium]|nr:hypothetical protein [Candidatus Binataceae bacterium]
MLRVRTILAVAIAIAVALPVSLPAAGDPASSSLTDYLHQHRLPAVGAQITTGTDGSRTVMLYGFVATQRGFDDAEKRARSFLHDPYINVINRVAIDPELLAANHDGAPADSGSTGSSSPAVANNAPPPANVGDIQQYEAQNQYRDPLNTSSGLGTFGGSSLLVPLIGGLFGYGMMGGFNSYAPSYYYAPRPAPFYRPRYYQGGYGRGMPHFGGRGFHGGHR